jgi:hypothetical protein
MLKIERQEKYGEFSLFCIVKRPKTLSAVSCQKIYTNAI